MDAVLPIRNCPINHDIIHKKLTTYTDCFYRYKALVWFYIKLLQKYGGVMPITTRWDNDEKTLIRNDFESLWSWDEFTLAMDTCTEWIAAVNYKVNIISNIKPGVIPRGNALSNGQRALRKLPENFGVLIVVTNPLAALLGKILRRIAPDLASKVIMVTDIEKAYETLEQLGNTS
jgi:hypothetical protein